ncbi:unnamed protein product [Urochloa humidicola]
MEEDVIEPRWDMLLLSGMRNPGSTFRRFTCTCVPPVPPRRSTRSTAPSPYKPKETPYGFIIMSEEEELRLNNLKARVMENSTFHDDTLVKLGLYSDIYKLLDNLGWRNFAIGESVMQRIDIALEMLVTMKYESRVINENGDEAPFLSFRLKNERRHISYISISMMLGFDPEAPEKVDVEDKELEDFWKKIAIDEKHTRQGICNIVRQIFHTWMSKRILGRMKKGKVIEQELNWMYAALVKKTKIDPSYIMVNRWIEEATLGFGKIGMACCLITIAIAMVPDIGVNLKFTVRGTEMDGKFLVQDKYISRNKSKGAKSLGETLRSWFK